MKKYTSGSFTATKYAIYKEDTDTITNFPAEIIADGENASATVYGNMQQTGTPTPTTPITPSECGDLETVGDKAGQYKIPIESANTSTTLYLGEVQSTRKIKKYEFTGNESWGKSISTGAFYITLSDIGARDKTLCTHFKYNGSTTGNPGTYYTPPTEPPQANFVWNDAATVDEWKEWLRQQKANGTPIILYMTWNTSQTGIVNEPLRTISDVADTVTATIPTIAAADNINVTTTLKPSAVDLTYTGWHKYDDKKRSGGAWV